MTSSTKQMIEITSTYTIYTKRKRRLLNVAVDEPCKLMHHRINSMPAGRIVAAAAVDHILVVALAADHILAAAASEAGRSLVASMVAADQTGIVAAGRNLAVAALVVADHNLAVALEADHTPAAAVAVGRNQVAASAAACPTDSWNQVEERVFS